MVETRAGPVGGPPNLRGKKAKNVGISPNVVEVKMAANEEVEDLGFKVVSEAAVESMFSDGTHGLWIDFQLSKHRVNFFETASSTYFFSQILCAQLTLIKVFKRYIKVSSFVFFRK